MTNGMLCLKSLWRIFIKVSSFTKLVIYKIAVADWFIFIIELK